MGFRQLKKLDCLPDKHSAPCVSPEPSVCLLKARLREKNSRQYSGSTCSRQTMNFRDVGESFIFLKTCQRDHGRGSRAFFYARNAVDLCFALEDT